MPNKMNEAIVAAAENFDKFEDACHDGKRMPVCKFGDCPKAECCFNLCRCFVINICELEIERSH